MPGSFAFTRHSLLTIVLRVGVCASILASKSFRNLSIAVSSLARPEYVSRWACLIASISLATNSASLAVRSSSCSDCIDSIAARARSTRSTKSIPIGPPSALFFPPLLQVVQASVASDDSVALGMPPSAPEVVASSCGVSPNSTWLSIAFTRSTAALIISARLLSATPAFTQSCRSLAVTTPRPILAPVQPDASQEKRTAHQSLWRPCSANKYTAPRSDVSRGDYLSIYLSSYSSRRLPRRPSQSRKTRQQTTDVPPTLPPSLPPSPALPRCLFFDKDIQKSRFESKTE